ncbi:wax ester/triacylglycerol synthase domain-containing protein [Variovorax sp. GT1P44]|uniref:wax ester/triacylglycerol synthase domain-containing protein n=1 Tax=Variovorax sp. GT1P44 TaxID=3443742 RepID=UPI003F456D18
MPALSAIDLAMFLLETPARPFNIGPLVLLRPPEGFKGNFADKLHAKLLKRPPGPPFNYRFRKSLTRLPSVEPMADPDIREHVHRLTLDDATMDELLKEVCALHETQLDRSGLLWQFHVIDGLEDGRVALYGKAHHGIIDGRTFVKAVTAWLSDDPKDKEVRALWDGVPRSSTATKERADMVQQLLNASNQVTGALVSAAGLYGMVVQQGLRSLSFGKELALPFLKVSSAFDGALSSRRSYAYCTLPLPEMKSLGKAHGATINDLLLTALDMAMRQYLRKRGGSHKEPLVADMPVALADAKGGNQIAVLQFPLGKPGATVAERLAAIRAETGQLKESLKTLSSDTVMLYTTIVHAVPLLMEMVAAKAAPRLSNLMVSNPFGLTGQPYLMGAAVELVLPVSVVAAGHKLNVTAVTLGERLQLGFLAMPEAVPHIEELARLTEQAFEELRATLGAGDPAAEPAVASQEKPTKVAARTPRKRPAKAPVKRARAAPAKRGARSASA